MTAEEAKTKLESWRDLLKAKLAGVAHGPWQWDQIPLKIPKGEDAWILGPLVEAGGSRNLMVQAVIRHQAPWAPKKADRGLMELSRSAVPAMLAGIEAALNIFEDEQKYSKDKPDGPAMAAGSIDVANDFMCRVAEAYEPYFQEVQS